MDNLNEAKDIMAQTNPVSVQYAGFWRRLIAYTLDIFLVILIFVIITEFLIGPIIYLMINGTSNVSFFDYIDWYGKLSYYIAISSTIPLLLYESYFLSSKRMATLGKQWLGIKVTDTCGERLSFYKALLRAIFKYGIYIIGYIPVIGIIRVIFYANPFLIVLTKKKQAIHDYIANTVVVKTEKSKEDTPESRNELIHIS